MTANEREPDETAVGSGSPRFDAVVLAGGRGSRLGGAPKASRELGGERLVDRVIAAARAAGAARVIVVGPDPTGLRADVTVREDPPFSGPLAALGAALPEVRSPWIMLLASDLVRPGAVLAQLRAVLTESFGHSNGASGRGAGGENPGGEEAPDDPSYPDYPDGAMGGAILVDETGHRQWLAGCYHSAALRAEMTRAQQLEGAPVRAVLGRLRLTEVAAVAHSTDDIDTEDELAAARAALRKE